MLLFPACISDESSADLNTNSNELFLPEPFNVEKSINVVFLICVSGYNIDNHGRYTRDDSSNSDDGGDSQSTIFIIGGGEILNQAQLSQASIANAPNVAPTSIVVAPVSISSASTPTSPNTANLTSSFSTSAINPQLSNSSERLVRHTRIKFIQLGLLFDFVLINFKYIICYVFSLIFFSHFCSSPHFGFNMHICTDQPMKMENAVIQR